MPQDTLSAHEDVLAEGQDSERLIHRSSGHIEYLIEVSGDESGEREGIEVGRGYLSERAASFLWALHVRHGIGGMKDADRIIEVATDSKPALAAYVYATRAVPEGNAEAGNSQAAGRIANDVLAGRMDVTRQTAKNQLSRFEDRYSDELPDLDVEG